MSGDNIPIGYLYPPVLAQISVPLRGIPHFALAVGWSTAQAVCLAILLPLAYCRSARSAPERALLAIGFGLAFYPLQYAIFSGNVSGWLAIGVALSLADWPRIGGFVAALATCVKLLPLPMFVAALTDRRSRLAAVIPLAIIVTVSVAAGPAGVGRLRRRPAEHPADRDGGQPDESLAGARVRRVRRPRRGHRDGLGPGHRLRDRRGRRRHPRGLLATASSRWPSCRSHSPHRPCGTTTSASWSR